MNILVTGGCGFIGKKLCEHLYRQGHSLVILDTMVTGDRKWWDSFQYEQYPVSDETRPVLQYASSLPWVPPSLHIDMVYHLAAVPRVQVSFQDVYTTYQTNVMLTQQVLEFCRDRQIPMVFTSSCVAAFPTTSPYAATKRAAEDLCTLYRQQGVRVACVRLHNVYGCRERWDGMSSKSVVDIFVDRAVGGNPITVYGDGKLYRNFIHVNRVVSVLVELTEAHIPFHQAYDQGLVDLGSVEGMTILELAWQVSDIFGVEVRHEATRPGEAFHTRERVHPVLHGWAPPNEVVGYLEDIYMKEVLL